MKFKLNRSLQHPVFLPMTIFCIFLLTACGGGNSADSNETGHTGALNFSVRYHDGSSHYLPQAAQIDCDGLGIATVGASVYDSGDNFLAGGNPWPCDAGNGTITSVRSGSDRTIVVLGMSGDGNLIFRGQKTGISIVAGSSNDAGLIDCHAFVPSLQSPQNGAEVNADAMGLAWRSVGGGDRYRVKVWGSSDLDTPVIDQETFAVNFTPAGLSDATTYYWQVIAIDTHDNSGAGSTTWSFTTNAGHSNTAPVARITAPAQGSTFTAGDSISFSGSGSDAEDDNLSGDALVWTSNLNGEIGSSDTFSTNSLSIGSHQITLTARDSEGATGTDTVTITVNAVPVNNPPSAQITTPTQGGTFTSRDNISFSGSGNDTEDGSLTGDALVWTSDLDGEIGRGESFSTSDMSVGTHQITLTVTDSEDATGTDAVTLTVSTSPNNIDPVAQINTPANGQTFTSSDDISFTGIGSDTEDGYLSDDALIWTSDADGEIGRGKSFSSDRLTPGERTITLTVTDSDGATSEDRVDSPFNP